MDKKWEIWKVVNGKSIEKIDNGFVVFNLVEHDRFFVPTIKELIALIKEDDDIQIKKHLKKGVPKYKISRSYKKGGE